MKQPIRILFICHGNICRSPMAEYVMADMVNKAGLSSEFVIASAATSTEEIGNGVHWGTRERLRRAGIACPERRARQMTRRDYADYDLLIGMDRANLRNMARICGGDPDGKLHTLLEYAGSNRDIADPWYTGNFDDTYRDVVKGCAALLEILLEDGTARMST